MDVALLAFLILLNGVFAMSEMALTASRKARLQVMVEAGEPGAQAAMELHENPTKFLSTVQIGITSIGVLNGIVGEAAFAAAAGAWLHEDAARCWVRRPRPRSATGLVVVIITFLTIIFGELVPKRMGQMYPETVARLVAHADELAVHRHAAVRRCCCRPAPRPCCACWASAAGTHRSVTEEEIAASWRKASTPA
jgi:putative hemolysin